VPNPSILDTLSCSHDIYVPVRRAVWGITAMKRMSTLAALASPGAGELQANIDKYKAESEKEDINEVCPTSFSSVVLPLSNC